MRSELLGGPGPAVPRVELRQPSNDMAGIPAGDPAVVGDVAPGHPDVRARMLLSCCVRVWEWELEWEEQVGESEEGPTHKHRPDPTCPHTPVHGREKVV